MSICLESLLTRTQRDQATEADRALRRRADKTDPPPVLSRGEQIVAEGDRRRRAYREMQPSADPAMVFGAQVGYLNGQVKSLCNELDGYRVQRDAGLHYRDVDADIGTVTVGYTYNPGKPDRITSGAYFERTGDPGNPGYPSSIDVQEVWCNGVALFAWAPDGALDKMADTVLEAHEARIQAEAEADRGL